MIVTKFLRSSCGQATVRGNSSKAGRSLPASMAGGGRSRPDHPRLNLARPSILPGVLSFRFKAREALAVKRRVFMSLLGGAAASDCGARGAGGNGRDLFPLRYHPN